MRQKIKFEGEVAEIIIIMMIMIIIMIWDHFVLILFPLNELSKKFKKND